jgi:protein-S-isoprenylcysteine O-methyltransferase Ste14
MLKPLFVTLLPVLFLIVLFGGGALFQRRNIDMDGQPPINKGIFLSSKYLIVVMWAAMVMQIWGLNLSFLNAPESLKIISLLLWAAGFALLFTGRFGMGNSFRIGSPRESTSLKVEGLFRFSRNPMYLGVYATLLAPVLTTLNPIILSIAVFVVIVHHQIVLAEEQHLRDVFGREYLDYCSRVRRYL